MLQEYHLRAVREAGDLKHNMMLSDDYRPCASSIEFSKGSAASAGQEHTSSQCGNGNNSFLIVCFHGRALGLLLTLCGN